MHTENQWQDKYNRCLPFYKFSKMVKNINCIHNIRITKEIPKPQLKLLTKKNYCIPNMKQRIRKQFVKYYGI